MALRAVGSVRARLAAAAIVAVAQLGLPAGAEAQVETQQTCSEAHAYCMRLCNGSTTPAPPGWTCEAERCVGLPECLTTGFYRIGTQYGHHAPRRTSYGPYEKK